MTARHQTLDLGTDNKPHHCLCSQQIWFVSLRIVRYECVLRSCMWKTSVLLGSHGRLCALSLTQAKWQWVNPPPPRLLRSLTIKDRTHLSPGRAEAGAGECLLSPQPASPVVINSTCGSLIVLFGEAWCDRCRSVSQHSNRERAEAGTAVTLPQLPATMSSALISSEMMRLLAWKCHFFPPALTPYFT